MTKLTALFIFLTAFSITVHATQVMVIAPGLDNAIFAKSILAKNNWQEGNTNATRVLVIIRSANAWPLSNNYQTYGELADAANAVGGLGDKATHVYIFNHSLNGEYNVIKHARYNSNALPK